MIIVDLNQVVISNFMMSIGNHTNITIEEDLLRHMVLNSLRSYNAKFRDEYGEMIIACDASRSWRKDAFQYYKANRALDRKKSEIDWNALFTVLNKIRDELKQYLPYRVIEVVGAEADDIIGTLCIEFGDSSERILIISGDKDFRQLQTFLNVFQYDPVRKKMMTEQSPERYLREHIMRGDRGDGIPNFLSKDDVFVVKGRQKQLRELKIEEYLKAEKLEDFCNDEMLRGYKRNEQLIDLTKTPQNIRTQIMESYHSQVTQTRAHIFSYLVANKLKLLITDIDQF